MNGSQRAAQPAVSSSSFTRFTTPENRRASSVSSQSRFLTPEETAFCILDAPTSYIKKPT